MFVQAKPKSPSSFFLLVPTGQSLPLELQKAVTENQDQGVPLK